MIKLEIVGKNKFEPSDANKEYAKKRMEKIGQYIIDDQLMARMVLKVYPEYHKAEVTLQVKNAILRAEVCDKDLYKAIDLVTDKLITQIKKYKSKHEDNKTSRDKLSTPKHKIVKNKDITLHEMSKEEAIDQLEYLGHDFYIYIDKETKKTCCVYLRNDGDYAVIETK